MIAGALSIARLPVAQYPAIAPPAISVTAVYPGASARTLEETVTQVIEQRMSGLDGLRYISSSSDATGTAAIELTFEPGTNPDIAQVQVQNKLQLAMPQLPQEVQRQGVRVAKSQPQLPDDRLLRIDRRQHEAQRHLGLRCVEPAGAAEPHLRRRRRPGLRHAVRDADLAQPRQAQRVPADAARRQRRDPGPERADLGRTVRRRPLGQRAAAQRDDHRADPPADARGVREHPAARHDDWLAGAPPRRRPRRAHRRELRGRELLQRQPDVGRWASASRSAPTRSTPRTRCARASRSCRRRSRPGLEIRYPVDTTPFVRDLDRGGRDHAVRGDRPGLPGHAALPPELPRDADPDARRAGRAARHLRRARGCSATASTR